MNLTLLIDYDNLRDTTEMPTKVAATKNPCLLKTKMKDILKLSNDEACSILKKITDAEAQEWDINFIENEGELRLDEGRPIVCDGLNLRLFVGTEVSHPSCMFPNCEIIGVFGDDEFAWVCRQDDGGIVEVDEYDLKKGRPESDLVFPTISHYLLFVLNYQG